MKTMKRILATLLAIALIAVIPGVGTMTAKAATPKTFTVKYLDSLGEWRVQMLPQWNDSELNGDLNFLSSYLAEGDAVVVLGDATHSLTLTINTNIANLTLYGVHESIIYANGNITDIYVLKGSTASLNGKYDNIYVYDDSICNVNHDVKNLYILGESCMKQNVAALGKVDFCKLANGSTVFATMYNVKSGTLRVNNGANATPADCFSTTEGSTTTPTTGGNTGSQNNTSNKPTSPKTGEADFTWLLVAGAVCVAGAYAAKKKFA